MLQKPKYLGSVLNALLSCDLRLTEATTAFFVQIPVIGIDSLAWKTRHRPMEYRSLQYFRWVRTWSKPIRPLLYVNDLDFNFNCILPLALVSLPALGVTYIFDRKRLRIVTSTSNQSSPFTVLSLILAPHCIYGFAFSVYDHIKNVSNSTARRL